MSVFEKATRRKFRYPSPVGDLTTEQLWELPLKVRSGPDLDTVARTINSELKDVSEGSFVEVEPDPKQRELGDKLEVVKRVIEVKLRDQKAAEKRAKTIEERKRLREALASKEQSEIEGLSREEILKRLGELDTESDAA